MGRKDFIMLKITINKGKGIFEFEGSDKELAVESGMVMYHLIKNLRKSGRSDEYIRGLFEIVMDHHNE